MKITFNLWPLILILMACSTQTHKSKNSSNSFCTEEDDLTHRHLKMAITSQANSLARCYQNYIKFETIKTQTFSTCTIVHVNRSGSVKYVKVLPVFGKIPNDLQMCLEQEYWSMNFKALQLEKDIEVRFPLNFSSK